jgi:hypothetical protein
MSTEFDRLEREIDAELDILRAAPVPLPSAMCVARVKAAVAAECRRVKTAERRRMALRLAGAAAAAVLLSVLPRPAVVPATPAVDPEQIVTAWAAAFDRTGTQLTGAMDGLPRAALPANEEEADDLLRSFDAALNELEAL